MKPVQSLLFIGAFFVHLTRGPHGFEVAKFTDRMRRQAEFEEWTQFRQMAEDVACKLYRPRRLRRLLGPADMGKQLIKLLAKHTSNADFSSYVAAGVREILDVLPRNAQEIYAFGVHAMRVIEASRYGSEEMQRDTAWQCFLDSFAAFIDQAFNSKIDPASEGKEAERAVRQEALRLWETSSTPELRKYMLEAAARVFWGADYFLPLLDKSADN